MGLLGLPASDAERHVERHSPTLEKDREGVALLHIAREPLEVGHRADGLAVELLDDVAALVRWAAKTLSSTSAASSTLGFCVAAP